MTVNYNSNYFVFRKEQLFRAIYNKKWVVKNSRYTPKKQLLSGTFGL